MKLRDFLLCKTRAEELCVICDPWISATAYIDHEDLFIGAVKHEYQDMEVKRDEWKWFYVCDKNGIEQKIKAHYIYV